MSEYSVEQMRDLIEAFDRSPVLDQWSNGWAISEYRNNARRLRDALDYAAVRIDTLEKQVDTLRAIVTDVEPVISAYIERWRGSASNPNWCSLQSWLLDARAALSATERRNGEPISPSR